MTWFRIEKSGKRPLGSGLYSDWKELIRAEGRQQCVYCAIQEFAFGGYRNFHVEHFRPKSRFPTKEHDYDNLFYACSICNSFKGNDWPGEPKPDHSESGYVDPSLSNLADIFYVDSNCRIIPRNPAAAYMIERLFLNRPQLVLLRAIVKVRREIALLRQELRPLVKGGASGEIATLLIDAGDLIDGLNEIAPYEPADVKR